MFGFLYASRVVTYSKIYGGLGLVPVFMAGLYLSWLILLFGAQVAYAFQNRASYFQQKLVENVNQRGKEFIALRLMTLIGQRFQHGEPPVTLQQMSAEIGIPSKLVQQILQPLLAARIVTEIAGAEAAFTPARPLDDINAHHILRAIRVQGQETATRDEPARAEVLGEFAKIEEAERDAASRITLSALVNRAQARLELSAAKTSNDEIRMNLPKTASITPELKTIGAEEIFEPKSDSISHAPEPVVETQIAHPVVTPSDDAEREFPL
jgi:membrane protein